MSKLEKTLELDVDRDVLDIPTDPPRRRLVDFLPGWFVHFTRTRWGLPNITPYERWLLCLILLKTAARVYAQTAKELLGVALVEERPTPGEVPLTTSTGDKSDPFRWS